MRHATAAVLILGLLCALARGAGDAPHLAWRHTYAEALRDARLRNVPVWITRHKDG